MKKVYILSIMTIIVFALCSCGNGETVSKEQYDEAIAELSALKAQNNESNDPVQALSQITYNCVTMEIPETWAASENKGDSVNSYTLDHGKILIASFGSLNVNFSNQDDVKALINWINADGTVSINESTDYKIDGENALRLSGTASVGDYKDVDMIVFKAGNEYIHITLFSDDTKSYTTDFEKSVETIKINDDFSASSDDDSINGFSKAEFERFNSLASENGLGGSKIFADGTITELITNPTGIMAFVLQQDVNNEWLIQVGLDPIYDRDMAEGLVGKKIRVFGIYPGLSLEYEKPLIMLWDANAHIQDEDKNKYYQNDFLSNAEHVKEWCDQNDCELLISDISNEENKGTVKKSSGLVSSVFDSSKTVYMYQKQDDDYKLQSIDLSTTYFNNTISFDGINEGDAVTVYYFISGDDSSVQAIGIEKKDNVGFTADDMKKAYCNSCKTYTYKEIARNPDSVKGERAKFTGKVIQVLEDGSSVVLRVNITAKKYYYDDTIYVKYTRKSDDEDRILEDDIVNIYGTLSGLESYTSITNQTITLPKVYAEYIDIK